jgi:hypothetical protein
MRTYLRPFRGTLAVAAIVVLTFLVWQLAAPDTASAVYFGGGETIVDDDVEPCWNEPIVLGPAADDDEGECGPCDEETGGDEGGDGDGGGAGEEGGGGDGGGNPQGNANKDLKAAAAALLAGLNKEKPG